MIETFVLVMALLLNDGSTVESKTMGFKTADDCVEAKTQRGALLLTQDDVADFAILCLRVKLDTKAKGARL